MSLWRPHVRLRSLSRATRRQLAIALSSLCLAWGPLASGATAQVQFESWTTENGLPQNSVNDILQTRDGYVWLATHGGLVRFDGVRFVVFDGSFPGIGSQRVRALHEDRRGTLWAATEDGMLIRYQDGRFTTYTKEDGFPLDVALRIDEGHDGSILITWFGGVITKMTGQHVINLRPNQWSRDVAPHDLSDDLWWAQDSDGVHVLVNGRVKSYSVRVLAEVDVSGVNADSHGNLWIRTAGGGVLKAARGQLERYTTVQGLPSDRPQGSFHEGSAGDIWFFDRRTLKLYRIRHGSHELMTLPDFRSFYVDRDGSSWVGTTMSGVHRFTDPTISVYTERHGLSHRNVYSILEDSSGAVWVGGGRLHRYAHGRFAPYNSAGDLRLAPLYQDRVGRLWVRSTEGLGYIQNGAYRWYRDPSGFLTGAVWAMLEDRAGTFWFATNDGLVKSRDGRFARYTTREGVADDRITALFEDGAGALWIGTQQGLTCLKDGVFTTYTPDEGFIGNQVRAFHEDSDGFLWVGTYDGGLYRVASGRLTRYTRNDGLHDNGIYQILEDDYGHFWMGSNRGIQRVSRHDLNEFAEGRRTSITSVVFDATDGLVTAEVNGGPQPSGLKRADGTLWFPTMGGVAVVDPAALRVDAAPPDAVIEEVRLAGEAVDFSGQVRVAAGVPAFDIRYTAPSFIKPDQVRFRYRMVGLDDNWVDAADRRVASFYRIPPGKYKFVVTASSPYGMWHADGQSLEVIVLPPVWQTWWFMALASMALAGAALAAHERRVRRLRAEHTRQLAFSRQIIDSQESERRRISNEMHDSLGQHVTIIRKRAQTAMDFTEGQQRVSAELHGISMLAEQMKLEMKEIAHGLRPYHLDKIGLSRTIEKMARKVGGVCALSVATDVAFIDDLLPDDSQIHIYRIVQESLNNVVKHANATHVKLTVTRNADVVQIGIVDNGDGFDSDSADAAGQAHQAFGLIGIRERARLLGGTVVIRSDRRGGTTISVTFPVQRRGRS